MDLTRVDTIVQFTPGSATVWNDVNVPVPAGAVVIDTVNKVMKEGDGINLYANLPICLDYNFNHGTSGAIIPTGNNLGMLATSINSTYAPSSVKLTDILNSLTALNVASDSQNTAIGIQGANIIVASVTQGTADGTIVVCNNGVYTPGSQTIAQLIASLIATATATGSSMHITDLEWYTDSGLTQKINSTNDINDNATYWCQITGFHDTAELRTIDFSLATATAGITITNTEGVASCAILECIYGGTYDEKFFAVDCDSSDNIICVGFTYSEGAAGGNPTWADCLIVKFDNNLNILSRKVYGGATQNEVFSAVVVDSSGNIVVAGYAASESAGSQDALVMKFDSSLNIIARKVYGGATFDQFLSVTLDFLGNIICAGYTTSTGQGGGAYGDALVVKFDTNLNILAQKIYGGATDDLFRAVVCDSSGNIYCSGGVTSEGQGGYDALIMKFDTNLNVLYKKIYGGNGGAEQFTGMTVDSSNNIICVGYAFSESVAGGNPTYNDALIVKFDSSLNILARKIYGGAYGDAFHAVSMDSSGNIICVGGSYSEGSGFPTYCDAFIIKFDFNLNVIFKKRYGGSGSDDFLGMTIDSTGNIVCAGYTTSVGSGVSDCLVLKLPSNPPAGSVTGTVLTGLTLADATLSTANSTLTLATSNLTLATPSLTFANSTLTLANSNLSQTKDTLTVARQTTPTSLITTIYDDVSSDGFNATIIDSSGNIICVGSTNVAGLTCALVCKFDSSFNPIARKTFVGTFATNFKSVVTDLSNNIICVGSIYTASGGFNDGIIVKFDPILSTVISQKTYGGAGVDIFSDIAIDPSGNYIVVGQTTSEGLGGATYGDCLIVKFNYNDLTILARKRYGGTGEDLLSGVAIDSVGNAICVGWTASEGRISGLMLKLDANLNIVIRKVYNSPYGGTGGGTYFRAVAITSANTIYVAGYVSAGAGVASKMLVVKLDSSFNPSVNVLYGSGIGFGYLAGIALDSSGNVIASGWTNSEGAGSYDCIVLKFTSNLSILGRKLYGSIGTDSDQNVVVDSSDNIIVSGSVVIGATLGAIVTKFPGSMPSGVYTNKFFIDLALSDSNMALVNDTPTVSNSVSTMADSGLTLSNGTMSFGNANGAIVTDTTIMDATPNIFKVAISNIAQSGTVVPTFSVVTNDGAVQVGKSMNVNVHASNVLECVYYGSYSDYFVAGALDSSGNVICAGYTCSEGTGSVGNFYDCLVVKFDSNLNILARKLYGSAAHDDYFYSVAVDSNDSIVCVGFTDSEGTGRDALVVKFDNNLNALLKMHYGGSGAEVFSGVAVDSFNSIICVGYTATEGSGPGNYNGLVVKFDTNLNILSRQWYGGTGNDTFNGVVVDSSNNIICVGYTASEGSGQDALVVKYDANLIILSRKIYGGVSYPDSFAAVACDRSGNIICVGNTTCEGSGAPNYCEAIVVKFDSNLNIFAKKRYGGSADDKFLGVTCDTSGNVVCVGYTSSEGSGSADSLVVKFDASLNVIFKKRYGYSNSDQFNGAVVDRFGNIFCIGTSAYPISGSYWGCNVLKLPANIISGTFVGTVLTRLILGDSNLTLADSNLTLANSTLSFGASTLTLAASNLTLQNSALTLVKDTIYA